MEKTNLALQYHWLAVYVKSRTEKKALKELQDEGIEAYLPLQNKLRQWSDRKKWVEIPLIPGYIFVWVSRREYENVLQSNYTVCYVTFEGVAAIIPNKQIDDLKLMLTHRESDIEITRQTFEAGQIIKVIAGPMIGLVGKLVRIKGKDKVAIELEQLGYSALIEIPINNIAYQNTAPKNDE
jgi:transcription antitermination factor NusG